MFSLQELICKYVTVEFNDIMLHGFIICKLNIIKQTDLFFVFFRSSIYVEELNKKLSFLMCCHIALVDGCLYGKTPKPGSHAVTTYK